MSKFKWSNCSALCMLSLQNLTLPPLSLSQDISICMNEVNLDGLSGNVSEFFKRITCDELSIGGMKLYEDETRSLSEMLQTRVKKLTLNRATLDYNLLVANYDGRGHCDTIRIHF